MIFEADYTQYQYNYQASLMNISDNMGHTDRISNVEFFQFSNGTYSLFDLIGWIESDAPTTDVFRFLNTNTGGHFFTSNIAEKEAVLGLGNFKFEGVGFEVATSLNTQYGSSVDVFRFNNHNTGSHFFTASTTERDLVLGFSSFRYEGSGFKAFTTQVENTLPVYRFLNENTGGHFFTQSEAEKSIVVGINNFKYEGVGFYAYADI